MCDKKGGGGNWGREDIKRPSIPSNLHHLLLFASQILKDIKDIKDIKRPSIASKTQTTYSFLPHTKLQHFTAGVDENVNIKD